MEQLNRGKDKVADAVRAKVDIVFSKPSGYEELKKVVAGMSSDLTVKVNFDLSTTKAVKLKYTRITSCNVERSFCRYKSVLGSSRRKFTFQHLKEMFVIHFYGKTIKTVFCLKSTKQKSTLKGMFTLFLVYFH